MQVRIKKDAYNNAVTTAQGIIDQTTSPTLDPTVINQAAGQVSTTKNALNGNENLEAAKQQATQSLGSLDNLNNAQNKQLLIKLMARILLMKQIKLSKMRKT